jgi:putative SOS response-associated peptidase YedK
MCGGIQYQNQKIYFPQPNAKLPVMLRHGGVIWVLWGKRVNEGPGKFPNGGWARLDSIKVGKWKPWHPKPALIPADCFLEKDHDKKSHWITLESGMFIQALLAERNDEHRVYIVTEETPPQYHWIHDRWPRLVRLSDQNKTAMEHT